LAIIPIVVIAGGFWLKFKSPESFQFFQELVGGVGGIILGIVFLAFLVLLAVNIILWVFLPLMVYSIKKSIEEAVREIKKINNTNQGDNC
jgi:cell division protein FtsB